MSLTDELVEFLEPREKHYKKYDTMGLFIEVRSSGAKYWRFRYVFDKKPNQISLGVYPGVSLDSARSGRDSLLDMLYAGQDPSVVRKNNKKLDVKVKKQPMTLDEAINGFVTDSEVNAYLECIGSVSDYFGEDFKVSRSHATALAHLDRIQSVWDAVQARKEKWREYNKKRKRNKSD